MIKRIVLAIILIALLDVTSRGADDALFVINEHSIGDPGSLRGYPGGYWGMGTDGIYLAGGADEENWLKQNGIEFHSIPFDRDYAALYIWYVDRSRPVPVDIPILVRTDDYLLSNFPPKSGVEFRRLTLKNLPDKSAEIDQNMILTYNSVVDSLIERVSQDTIIGYLAGLSGAAPVEIGGEPDTILTRYSGTDGNRRAARYIKETLERYGYDTEYHGFYGGLGRHLTAYSADLAWAVTEDSEAIKTTDGGQNWNVIPDGSQWNLWGVDNYGPDSVWITGNYGTIRFSSDGGENFSAQSTGLNQWLFGVDFISSNDGWIACDYGDILHTSDGGNSWLAQTTPTASRLYDVCFVDSDYGWAVGRDGVVIHTVNGGQTWIIQNSNSSERLYGVDFTDREHGWLVGWAGVVRRTTDGGNNWMAVDLGNQVEKYQVAFADQDHGLIAGWNGEFFTTTDGGDNWVARSSGTSSDFYGLAYPDPLNAFAFGNSVICKSSDGGVSWAGQMSNIESAWRNIIGSKIGTTEPDRQVIICAHMDNRSETPETIAPGSDDNGSGATAVIEAARIFTGFNFEKTIKFCLWTGEEQGLLGSAAYARDAFGRGDDIAGVFNFDMIAWDGNSDGSIELHCGTMSSSQTLGHLFEDVITDYDISLDPEFLTYSSTDRSDHASFWDQGYPAILGIEDFSSDFNPYYHSAGDNMNHIMENLFTEFTRAAVGAAATFAVPDTLFTGIGCAEQLPCGLTVGGSYPNPFNAAATITFALAARSDIDLAVYDILGRQVASLYTGPANAGTHRITWNANDQPSGIYFYRLTIGDTRAAGRMTLLK